MNRMKIVAPTLTHEIARWPTLREEFPLPAERGEGKGEGCHGNARSFSGDVFKAFPSPRPSPRSFLAGRGRRRSAACPPCLCRLCCGLLCKSADSSGGSGRRSLPLGRSLAIGHPPFVL